MLQTVLSASSKKTGLFTSPYITTTIEQIRVDDKYISPKDFIRIVDNLRPHIAEAELGRYGAPSSFEILLAVALTYFKEQKCEWVVLEVGLGGRYDATNVVESPRVTVITNIDYDHTEVLGNTLREIAYDKAGIIKKGSAFFTSETRATLLSSFKKICSETGVTFTSIEKQKDYQDRNKTLVRAIAKFLDITDKNIDIGIARAHIPCRFEIVEKKPYLILDGAHNRRKMASTVSNLKKLDYRRLIVLIAMADTKKDRHTMFGPLLSLADSVILTSTTENARRSIHPDAILPHVRHRLRKGTDIQITPNPHQALARARGMARASDCILATGSFFLTGELRAEWFPKSWVLSHRKSF
jgi:dihydrofolate synthase/folylpolyglutamate synthase